jgi:hypothetical protein
LAVDIYPITLKRQLILPNIERLAMTEKVINLVPRLIDYHTSQADYHEQEAELSRTLAGRLAVHYSGQLQLEIEETQE